MLECESEDEFDGYIDENYDSDENEVEFEVTDCLDSSNNGSLDAIESSPSSCSEYGSSG